MFINKYVPKSFDDVLVDKDIIKIILNRNLNIMLYGPPGSGKTTIVNVLVNYLRDNNYSCKVLNISENRGIKLIRNELFDINTDVIILDEMDSLTVEAQNMLNSMMNSNSQFIFVCNYINNINSSILSKCCCIRINMIKKELLFERIKFITTNEKIKLTDKSINYIIEFFKRDIRKILNYLENIKMIYEDKRISYDNVLNTLCSSSH